jgi:23S rRNA pseudouridine1911/1915/1917 synthase
VKTAASASGSLLDVLQLLVPGASKRTLRQMLSQGRVHVNGLACKTAAHPVQSGDWVEIRPRKTFSNLPEDLEILFEDSEILVARKPAGLLTVATIDERERTAYAYLRRHVKAHNPGHRLFIVHRLDKFASGVLVFAKSERVKSILKGVFSRHEIRRKYWAIVEGSVKENQGTIRSFLAQDRSLRMHSTEDPKTGKAAVTHFRVLRRLQDITALEVTLETGRKNQIRVHLSEMGHPIVGDRAYGSTRNPLGRLGLHAFHLGFMHPTKSTPLEFQTDPPAEFLLYLPRK